MEVSLHLAEAASKNGQWLKAAQLYEQLYKKDPSDEQLNYETGTNYLRANFPYKAISILRDFDNKFEDTTAAFNGRTARIAKAYYQLQQYPKIVELVDNYNYPKMYRGLAREHMKALIRLNKEAALAQFFTKYQQTGIYDDKGKSTNMGFLYRAICNELLLVGNKKTLAQYAKQFSDWVDSRPKKDTRNAAFAAFYQSNNQAAISYLKTAIIEENSLRHLMELEGLLGVAYARNKEIKKALSQIEKIHTIKNVPARQDVFGAKHYHQARIEIALNKKEQAITSLKESLKANAAFWSNRFREDGLMKELFEEKEFQLLTDHSQAFKFRSNFRQLIDIQKSKTASIGFGDLDQDGDTDIVLANGRHWPQQNQIYYNSGKGKFTVSQPLDITSETSYATEVSDLDGDGDLDIAVANDNAPNLLYKNDGKGQFTRAGTFGNPTTPSRNLSLADIDLDGDVDLLITNRGAANEICINDGTGNFQKTINFGTNEDSTIDVEAVDIDRDDDMDLVLANRDGQQNYIYLNEGSLNFSAKIPFGTSKDETRAVAVGDFNSDGLLDIVTSNIGEANRLYMGGNALTFSEQVVVDTSANFSYSVTAGDLDLDGDLDLVFANVKAPNLVFLNEDKGKLWKKIQLNEQSFRTYDILLSDFNGDGRVDILEANSDELNVLYFNLNAF